MQAFPLFRRLASLAPVYVMSIFLATVSFLGFSDNSVQFSRDLFYRAFASFYPVPASKAASVVLLRDKSFEDFDTYPPKYGTHADFLNAILSFKPKAVFVDFAFIDDRDDPTISQLVDVARAYQQAGVPLYLPTYTARRSDGIRKELAAAAEEGAVRLVSFELGRMLWGTRVYPLTSQTENRATVSAKIIRDFMPDLATRISEIDEFEIWWGLPPDPFNCARVEGGCPSYSLLARFLALLKIEVSVLGWTTAKTDPTPLPYSPFVYAEEVADGDLRDKLEPVLAGKFVFYGPNLSIVSDLHPNPIFSFSSDARELPGIFFHAMALENLIDLGSNVKRPRSANALDVWLHDVLVISLIVGALALVRLGYFAMKRDEPGLGVETWIIFGAAFAVALVEFYGLGLGPSNWIGAFTMVGFSNVGLAEKAQEWTSIAARAMVRSRNRRRIEKDERG